MTRPLMALTLLGAMALVIGSPVDTWGRDDKKTTKIEDKKADVKPVTPTPMPGAPGAVVPAVVVPGAPVVSAMDGGCGPTYTTMMVTRYRCEVQTRQVPVTKQVMVPKTETYTYNVAVPVVTK